MTRIHDLLGRLARAETELAQSRFLAPCVPGVRLRLRVEGLVHSLRPNPPRFAGWGLFQPIDAKRAQLVARPDAYAVERYLSALRLVRLHLVAQAKGRAWWAVPINAASSKLHFGTPGPVVVHLTRDPQALETVRARFDGATFWYEGAEPMADPVLAEQLRDSLRHWVPVDALHHPNLTPEHAHAYAILHGLRAAERQRRLEEEAARRKSQVDERIAHALHVGGGTLVEHRERHGQLQVEWLDRFGRRHVSVLDRGHLDVALAGAVCLQGRDRDFDLASLVGVLSEAPEYFFQ